MTRPREPETGGDSVTDSEEWSQAGTAAPGGRIGVNAEQRHFTTCQESHLLKRQVQPPSPLMCIDTVPEKPLGLLNSLPGPENGPGKRGGRAADRVRDFKREVGWVTASKPRPGRAAVHASGEDVRDRNKLSLLSCCNRFRADPSRTFSSTYRTINWIDQLAAHRSLLPSQLAGLIHRGSAPASHGMSRVTPRSSILLLPLALANNLQQLIIFVRSLFISERFCDRLPPDQVDDRKLDVSLSLVSHLNTTCVLRASRAKVSNGRLSPVNHLFFPR